MYFPILFCGKPSINFEGSSHLRDKRHLLDKALYFCFLFLFRAKTIKNTVVVNEELTAGTCTHVKNHCFVIMLNFFRSYFS